MEGPKESVLPNVVYVTSQIVDGGTYVECFNYCYLCYFHMIVEVGKT